MSKGKRPVKIIIVLIFILAVVTGSFVYLLKWNSSYVVPQTKMSLELIDKLSSAQIRGKTVELSSHELNQIIGIYFKGVEPKEPLFINGTNVEFLGDKIKLNIPCNYKGFNVLASSEGKLSLNKDKIIYSPENISIGKVSIPKNYVLKTVEKYGSNVFKVEKDELVFDKSLIPLNIKGLQIKDNKLLLDIEKINLEEKIKSLYK